MSGTLSTTILGTVFADELSGTGGDDIIYGGSVAVNRYTNDGNDTVYARGGNDIVYGGGGNDLLVGDEGSDILIGSAGNDILFGTQMLSTGSNDVDLLYGGAAVEGIPGGSGSDTFVLGNAGFNFYTGGPGYAVIYEWDSSDYIQVMGSSRQNYRLDKSQNLVEGTALDTAIYYGSDLVAIVANSTDVSMRRDFKYV
jgi:Ca2+-binding RTX toxin-like protein